MQDLFDLRLWLEPEAAALAAKRAVRFPDHIAAMRDFCQREEEVEDRADVASWLTDHYRAHRRIAVLSANAELDRVLSEVLLKRERYHALDVISPASGTRSTGSTHRALMDAIATGDSAEARELAAQHVSGARDRAVTAVLDSEALRTVDLTSLGPSPEHRDRESSACSA
ncbi:FCD domain-containing protein [Streptomyces sp. NPDC096311]|uniref:FCD domain-containing protein n=1 Tax=Streptomyces sp. NPDC096311 TaxID=3366083 RepID=UPI003808ED65